MNLYDLENNKFSKLHTVLNDVFETNFNFNMPKAKLEKVAEATILESYPTWSDEQIESAIAMSKKMQGFGMISAMVMIMSLFFGFIVSLIAGLIMKKAEEVD